jgi:hypothetical protein
MKRITLILLLILIWRSNTLGQDDNQEASFANEETTLFKRLADFGATHLTERRGLDSLCVSGCTFIRFKITNRSVVNDISFSAGTPPQLKVYFTQMLQWTNGYWNARKINGKYVESKYMILPILYSVGVDCAKENSLYSNFWRMLWFDDETVWKDGLAYRRGTESIDCILLHPFLIKSGIP